MPTDAAIPLERRGLWRRLALERADGSGDITTTVLWLQTATLYADIRLPAARPAFGRAASLATLSDDQARWLAMQEGFAGRLHLDGDDAHWERRIDFRPLAGPPDEGRLVASRRMMVETGRHEAYVEHWWNDDPPAATDTETIIEEPARILLRAGRHFILAHDRRPERPPPAALLQLIQNASSSERARLLDCEISYGQIEPAGWRITLSTLPFREGALIEPA